MSVLLAGVAYANPAVESTSALRGRGCALLELLALPQKQQEIPQLRSRRFNKLASYDPAAWEDFVENTFVSSGHEDVGVYHELLPVIEAMPIELRRQVIQKVGEKFQYANSQATTFSPKRASNAFLTALLPAKRLISEGIAKGLSPLEAYGEYLDLQKTLAFEGTPNGRYRADEVMKTAKAIQGAIVKWNPRVTGPVTLFGSLPNGRAKAGSDLDLLIPSIGLSEQEQNHLNHHAKAPLGSEKRKAFDRSHLGRAREQLAQAVLSDTLSQDLNLSVECHYRELDTLERMSAFAPIVLQVSAGKIELLVYDKPVSTQIIHPTHGKRTVYKMQGLPATFVLRP